VNKSPKLSEFGKYRGWPSNRDAEIVMETAYRIFLGICQGLWFDHQEKTPDEKK